MAEADGDLLTRAIFRVTRGEQSSRDNRSEVLIGDMPDARPGDSARGKDALFVCDFWFLYAI